MRVETVQMASGGGTIQDVARKASDLGLGGLALCELNSDPLVMLAAVALAQHRLRLSTAVAVIHARSPMAMARAARGLNELSQGSFVLGLGVSAQQLVELEYGAEYGPAGPRLRDYVMALKAIDEAWPDDRQVRYNGQYYPVTSMETDVRIEDGREYVRTPIHLAAMNRYNLRTAGSMCDGLLVHRVCSIEFLQEVMWRHVEAGAADAGASLKDFEVVVTAYVATGADDEEVQLQYEQVRRQIANYAALPPYQGIMNYHGFASVAERLALAAQGMSVPAEKAAVLVPDEMVDIMCVTARHADLSDALTNRYSGVADTLRLSLPLDDVFGNVARALAGVPARA